MKMSVTSAATIFIVAAIILLFRGGADLCPNVTVSNIRRIKLEMPERDVRAILGEPFSAAPNQHQTIGSQPVPKRANILCVTWLLS